MRAKIFILLCFILTSCSSQKSLTHWETGQIQIKQLTQNTYQHISFLETESFGKVACNGLIIKNSDEALVLDSPVSNEDSKKLIAWVEEQLNCKIIGVVATHFHDDCIGGLDAFHDLNIPSYANQLTLEFIDEKKYTLPEVGFEESRDLNVGEAVVQLRFLGQGHTYDNIVGYFSKEKVLFGGCLVKAINAPEGFIGDANVDAWPNTVKKVKTTFPEMEIVIPGHGDAGGKELLDYTIELFTKH
ncbi:subclass B1 metallo-beta-lactamase [Allomuricauda sp. d1]|uniref:subclass B1 metallo-beta-lactamase n=1 Tax=Allomuricauda sp. d1 TaxID=3136725 RepID=UPI0031D2B8D7